MTEVLFYHLQHQPLERVLPTLLEKSLARGWRVIVQASSDERIEALDAHLWTYREESFLPHGTDEGASPDRQPVLLTVEQANQNSASVRFLVDGAEPPADLAYDRIVFVFDGYDTEQVEGARAQWKRLKGEGHSLTYWQQTPEGRWEKKA